MNYPTSRNRLLVIGWAGLVTTMIVFAFLLLLTGCSESNPVSPVEDPEMIGEWEGNRAGLTVYPNRAHGVHEAVIVLDSGEEIRAGATQESKGKGARVVAEGSGYKIEAFLVGPTRLAGDLYSPGGERSFIILTK